MSLDLNATIMETSMANRHLTAICRALAHDAKILFMDEPTTALAKQEVDNLLNIVVDPKQSVLAVVFISHKLDEVFRVADQIAIFRGGQKAGDFDPSELDRKKLAYFMTGRDVEYPRCKRVSSDDRPVLKVEGLSKKGQLPGYFF